MELDPRACYRALRSRDARFDGRFFTGVTSTGIYCRPVCPARTPARRNVSFYATAAAAQEAGFRPCLRCRPEAAPGTPAWRGTRTTVSRALRLLAESPGDRPPSVEDLAARLGVGDRHLRRLFAQHVGASPVSVAQTHRLLFAKRLIDETRLPMAHVAVAAGYASVRRFNAAVRNAYGKPPTALRRLRAAPANGAGIVLDLAYRPPYAWDAMLAFLARRAVPGVEAVEGGEYRRSIRLDGSAGVVAVSCVPEAHALRARFHIQDTSKLLQAVSRLRDVFDLHADAAQIDAHLAGDPSLAPLVAARPGLRVPGAWDPFELAVRAVLGQQVSVAAARTLAGRLVDAFGEALPAPYADAALRRLFPAPERLAGANLTRLGLTRARAATLRSLARAVAEGRVCFDAGSDPGTLLEQLQRLPGIGPWTAQYIGMRALEDPDAFPAGDLGLRAALADGSPWSESRLAARAERWRPWRAYAALHLWTRGGA